MAPTRTTFQWKGGKSGHPNRQGGTLSTTKHPGYTERGMEMFNQSACTTRNVRTHETVHSRNDGPQVRAYYYHLIQLRSHRHGSGRLSDIYNVQNRFEYTRKRYHSQGIRLQH